MRSEHSPGLVLRTVSRDEPVLTDARHKHFKSSLVKTPGTEASIAIPVHMVAQSLDCWLICKVAGSHSNPKMSLDTSSLSAK